MLEDTHTDLQVARTHADIRALIDQLRDEFKHTSNMNRQLEIQAEIDELIPQLSRIDRKIEKKRAKRKALESEGNLREAALLKMEQYILKSTKHINHLIQATQENDPAMEHEHFHRLKSRYEHLFTMIENYNKEYRS